MSATTSDRPHLSPVTMAITDRRQFGASDEAACRRLSFAARAWADAGIDIIQIRETGLTDRRLLALVRDIRAQTAHTACAVVVNDRADVALAGGAAGVHLPAAGLPPGRVRAAFPPPFLIGRSVHDPDEARAAAGAGCDYLVLGTIFQSRSKPAGHPVAGLQTLAAARDCVTIPLLAVGGITIATAPAAFRAGADGVAAITLFSDPVREESAADRAAAGIRQIVRALHAAYAASRGAASQGDASRR